MAISTFSNELKPILCIMFNIISLPREKDLNQKLSNCLKINLILISRVETYIYIHIFRLNTLILIDS